MRIPGRKHRAPYPAHFPEHYQGLVIGSDKQWLYSHWAAHDRQHYFKHATIPNHFLRLTDLQLDNERCNLYIANGKYKP